MALFTVITKDQLRRQDQAGEDPSELCGPAALTMLLQSAGEKIDILTVVAKMKQHGAFVRGVGTILSAVPNCFDTRLIYLGYMPLWLLKLLLGRGYTCAHSIRQAGASTGHIIFVCKSSAGAIHFYDPNQATTDAQQLTFAEWRQCSNRRAVIAKQVS